MDEQLLSKDYMTEYLFAGAVLGYKYFKCGKSLMVKWLEQASQ